MVIGLTVVSFATSAPELIVSLNAALKGSSDIALGNVIGSNIANIGLVLGLTALIGPLMVDRNFFRMNWPVMTFFSILLYLMLSWGHDISRFEGVALLILLSVYLYILVRDAKKNHGEQLEDKGGLDTSLSQVSKFKIVVWLIIGGVALYGGSEFLVKGAVEMAESLGVSERTIAVTMIAVGTSVPELAASIIAAAKKEKAISLGNLIGSNIFNISCVLGVTSLIHPVAMKNEMVLNNDMIWLLAFAFILLPLSFLPQRGILGRYKGLIIVVGYGIFVTLAFG